MALHTDDLDVRQADDAQDILQIGRLLPCSSSPKPMAAAIRAIFEQEGGLSAAI
jgi:hypothetical protein